MSAWGASAKSCNTLLQRVERNDPQLTDLIILPNKTFGGTEVERLAAALSSKKNTNLISLSASGHKIPTSSLRTFAEAMKSNTTVKRLAIGDKTLGDEGVIALYGNDNGFHNLEEVDLAYKNIGKEGMENLGGGQSLKNLNLSRNPKIDNDGLIAFCTQSNLPKLQTLNLAECNISGKDGLEALQQLLDNNTLKTLILSSNPLGPESCIPLKAFTQKIKSLSLRSCQLGNAGIKTLCQGATTIQLQELDLSDNRIEGEEGGKIIADAFEAENSWNTLLRLKLGNNPLGNAGVTAIANSLQTLEELDLTQTSCGIDGAVSLIINNSKLQKLRLFNNQLGNDGFNEIAKILSSTNLIELDLGGNKANVTSVKNIIEALLGMMSTSLKVIEIGANETNIEIEHLIVNDLKKIHPVLDVARDKPRQQQEEKF